MTQLNVQQKPQTSLQSGHPSPLCAQYDRVLKSPSGGTYCFTLEARDQAKVLVNGDLLIDLGEGKDAGEQSKHVALEPGMHHIQLRYQERNGEANLRLSIGQTLASNTLPDSRAMPHTHLMEIQQNGSKATVL